MKKTQCPACNSDVIIEDDAYKGDMVDCPNCESELEIVSLNPPSLEEIDSEPNEEEAEEE